MSILATGHNFLGSYRSSRSVYVPVVISDLVGEIRPSRDLELLGQIPIRIIYLDIQVYFYSYKDSRVQIHRAKL